jgi:hypothetical protein
MSIIVNTAANRFWKVSGLILGQTGCIWDEEAGAYHEEYNFESAPALQQEKIDLITGRSYEGETEKSNLQRRRW